MTATYDVLLDATGDIPEFTRHVRGLEIIGQRVRLRLATFLGEWFLDESKGLDYLTWMATKPFPEDQVGALIVAEINATPGVVKVSEYSTTYDPAAQTFGLTAYALTEAGLLEVSVPPFGGGPGNQYPLTLRVRPAR